MPLPDAWGQNRRTSQAAIKAAAAQVATTNKNPRSFSPCAQAISESRKRSACSSVSRKIAPTSPAAAPAMSASSASTSRLPWPSSTCDVFWIIGQHLRSRQEGATTRRAFKCQGVEAAAPAAQQRDERAASDESCHLILPAGRATE